MNYYFFIFDINEGKDLKVSNELAISLSAKVKLMNIDFEFYYIQLKIIWNVCIK